MFRIPFATPEYFKQSASEPGTGHAVHAEVQAPVHIQQVKDNGEHQLVERCRMRLRSAAADDGHVQREWQRQDNESEGFNEQHDSDLPAFGAIHPLGRTSRLAEVLEAARPLDPDNDDDVTNDDYDEGAKQKQIVNDWPEMFVEDTIDVIRDVNCAQLFRAARRHDIRHE